MHLRLVTSWETLGRCRYLCICHSCMTGNTLNILVWTAPITTPRCQSYAHNNRSNYHKIGTKSWNHLQSIYWCMDGKGAGLQIWAAAFGLLPRSPGETPAFIRSRRAARCPGRCRPFQKSQEVKHRAFWFCSHQYCYLIDCMLLTFQIIITKMRFWGEIDFSIV